MFHDRRVLPAHKPTRASPAHKTAQCGCLQKGHSAALPKPSMPGGVYLRESNSSAGPVGVLANTESPRRQHIRRGHATVGATNCDVVSDAIIHVPVMALGIPRYPYLHIILGPRAHRTCRVRLYKDTGCSRSANKCSRYIEWPYAAVQERVWWVHLLRGIIRIYPCHAPARG
jgi:hypothetical protein